MSLRTKGTFETKAQGARVHQFLHRSPLSI